MYKIMILLISINNYLGNMGKTRKQDPMQKQYEINNSITVTIILFFSPKKKLLS